MSHPCRNRELPTNHCIVNLGPSLCPKRSEAQGQRAQRTHFLRSDPRPMGNYCTSGIPVLCTQHQHHRFCYADSWRFGNCTRPDWNANSSCGLPYSRLGGCLRRQRWHASYTIVRLHPYHSLDDVSPRNSV